MKVSKHTDKKPGRGSGTILPCLYFEKPGPQNTGRTLTMAARRAEEAGIRHVLVASSSGKTGLMAAELFPGKQLVVVTHSTGFLGPNLQELSSQARQKLLQAGARILTCQHAFGGVGRAVRLKWGTYELEEIVAYSLRLFGQGTKVAVEIALMACDAGLIPAAEPCLSIGGTGSGADTSLVLLPANAQRFFELKILEVVAKPFSRE